MKFAFLLISLIALLVACNSNSTSNVSEEEVITLRVGAGVGTTHLVNVSYLSRWMDEVEERTNGKVQFEKHYSGSVIAMGREYEGLTSGLVDIALPIFQMYDPVRFPLSEISMLPLLESDVRVATAAYEELVMGNHILRDNKTFYDYEWAERDMKMWTTPTTEGYNFSYARNSGPSNVRELANVTFRSSGRMAEIFSSKLGINAISLPAGDIYDGLSRGSIDGLYFSVPDWNGYGIDELIGYTIQGVNLGHFSHTFGMTNETWNSLPEDVQEVMDEVAVELLHADETYAVYDERLEKSLQTNEAHGGIMADISEQPIEVQEAINQAIVETWIEWIDANEKNGLPGKETALLWRDLVIKYGGDVPDAIKEME